MSLSFCDLITVSKQLGVYRGRFTKLHLTIIVITFLCWYQFHSSYTCTGMSCNDYRFDLHVQ